MRIAYISAPAFADCDVPLIASLHNKEDLTYVIRVSKTSRKQSMLNIDEIKEDGIYPAAELTGLETIGKYVDLSNVYVFWQTTQNKLKLILSEIKLLRFISEKKIDVVHITWPLNLGSSPLYLYRKKMILTVHDPLPHSSNITKGSQFYRNIAMRLINRFILLNQTQREDFIKAYHLEEKKIYNSRLGVYYHLSDISVVCPKETNYILFFGQISSYKGLDILCEAMRKVRKHNQSHKLIVAGKGDIYFNINQFVEDGTIEFLNYYIPDEELAGLIKYANFAVCPYIDATQSGVIMSSYSMSTPVIVTDVGGLPEMVDYGKYGPIVPAGNVDSLASTILTLLENNEMVEEYRKRINEDYKTGKYSWESIAAGIIDIYKDFAEKHE